MTSNSSHRNSDTVGGLDTSGSVRLRREDAPWKGLPKPDIYWSDLSPFAQGYVTALFASMERGTLDVPVLRRPENSPCTHVVGFSDLAPETLAAILKDCANWLDCYRALKNTQKCGQNFWRHRQESFVPRKAFPPLTVYLGDDGKVRTRPQDLTQEDE